MRVAQCVAALGLLLAPLACEEATGPVSADHVGVFELQSYNGNELPLEFDADDPTVEKLELMGSSRVLQSDGSYRSEVHWRQTVDGDFIDKTVRETGSFYSLGEGSVGFHPEGDSTYGGRIDGDVLIIQQQGTMVFVR